MQNTSGFRLLDEKLYLIIEKDKKIDWKKYISNHGQSTVVPAKYADRDSPITFDEERKCVE